MEAATKRGRTDNRRCSGREGDWVCLYCSNYNYSFRTICTGSLMKAIAVKLKLVNATNRK